MGYRDYSTAKGRIVDATGHGDFTTIASALSASSSGETIFIRPGTYTENLTLKAGVNLTAFECDGFSPNVTIAGTCSFTAAGTVQITGVRLQTNSAVFLSVTGASASVVYLNNCYLNCTNNTGITYSSSSASSSIKILNCIGDIGAIGITFFAHTSSGRLLLQNTIITNTGGSSTASTCTVSVVDAFFSQLFCPLSLSGTAAATWEYCLIDTSATNSTGLTANGSITQSFKWCRFACGAGSCATTSSTLFLEFCTCASSNVNVLTGAGELKYAFISFPSSSSGVNTATQTALATLI